MNITILLVGHDFHFEIENVCRLFFPLAQITAAAGDADALPPTEGDDLCGVAALRTEPDGVRTLSFRLCGRGTDRTLTAVVPADTPDMAADCERELCSLLYRLLCDLTCRELPWGMITGVRPVKLMRRLAAESDPVAAVRYFREKLHTGVEKSVLCRRTLALEDEILALSGKDSFSLYISIPFCPTRCDYCSFVSQTVSRAAKLVPEYVTLLAKELTVTGALARELGLRLETVYMGGGTPTTLSAEQLAFLLETVGRSFDLSAVREYTVEAGRPDTVTADKMAALKAAGVGRVSINPQTLHDTVLQAVGRRHTVAQFYEAFDLARRAGFDNINCDLIAGLPEDTPDGFAETLEDLLALQPESVTVHALALKRAANLMLQGRAEEQGRDTERMVAFSADRLSREGYRPYYLYRQSRTAGGQENVGWAKPGFEGLYNVYMMDETHTVLGCGAGAVTKLKRYGTDELVRVFNYKYPYEYNSRHDEMLARKEQVRDFYARLASL